MYQEIELKLQLSSAADVERLLSAMNSPCREEPQENTYFDDEVNALSVARVAVRLRCMPGEGLLTVKGEGSSVGGLSRRPEAEERLTLRTARELLANPAAILPRLPSLFRRAGLDTGPIGSLRNLRAVARMHTMRRRATLSTTSFDLPLEIDESTYPDDSVVFELEVEFGDGQDIESARRELFEFLDVHAVHYRSSDLSKRARLARILDGDGSS